MFPLEGMTGQFSGRGFVAPIPHSDDTFTFSVPQDSQYEIIIRYEVSTTLLFGRHSICLRGVLVCCGAHGMLWEVLVCFGGSWSA